MIDLLHTAPAFDVRAGAYLLCALQQRFLSGDVILAVVDPGVGGPRAPLMVEADGKWFVGVMRDAPVDIDFDPAIASYDAYLATLER